MAAGFPRSSRATWGVHQFVAVLNMLLTPEIFDQQPDRRALGMPEHQARTDFILDRDQVEFFAELSVVSPLDLFQFREMRVQFRLCRKGGPVDPLQHGIALVATPIGPTGVQQLECADMAGRGGGALRHRSMNSPWL